MAGHATSRRNAPTTSKRATGKREPVQLCEQGSTPAFGKQHDRNAKTRPSERVAGAAGLHALLRENFEPDAADEAVASPAQQEPATRKPSPWKRRALKSLIGVALLVTVGWIPAQRLFQVSSVEAVVNARLVKVRAPIAGVVASNGDDLKVGGILTKGVPLVAVSNPRADRGQLTSATERLQRLEDDRQAVATKLDTLEGLRADLRTQLTAFRTDRIRQIGAQVAEADAQISAAEATLARDRAQANRLSSLKGEGVASMSAYEDATSAAAISEAKLRQARAARQSLVIERDALEHGTYLGDGYNDQPRSAQRLDELAETIASLQAQARTDDMQISTAKATVAHERQSYALQHEASLTSPVSGKIWQVLTSPGEQVVAGQELMTLVDCSQTVVTAAVSEAVYNSLSVGTPATFTFREGGAPLKGKVVQLSGVAAASSNFAIIPSALKKGSYRVTVAVDDPGHANACAVGRTGRVVFGSAAG